MDVTIHIPREIYVWLSFFVLFLIHTAIAVVPHLTKSPREAVGGSGLAHALVTLLYAGVIPYLFPQGIY